MALNSNKYSIWISVVPATVNSSRRNTLPDTAYMYVGGGSSPSYDMTYISATTGILGRGTAGAIFVDGTGGAVGRISISCTRTQPESYSDPNDSGVPSISYDYTNISNAKFMKTIKAMREIVQMYSNAYMIRIYNLNEAGAYKEYPVFLDNYQCNIDLDRPVDLDVSISYIQRNILKGYN